MTLQRTFKQSVRDRMKKTGERYTTARAMLLRGRTEPKKQSHLPAGLFPGYPAPGGISGDTGALRGFLAARGLPLDEAMVAGLCGGIGFLYAAFVYPKMPPMLSILGRYDTMPDAFIGGGIARLAPKATIRETGSATVAKKTLDAALAAKQPVLCVVDCVAIRADADGSTIMPGCHAPTVVTVAGIDGDDLLIDDGGLDFRRIGRAQFNRARGLYKKAKNRLIALAEPPGKVDLAPPVRAAIAATADRFTNAPYKGFASNFGFAGLEKWQRLLVNPRDKKGWRSLFPDGRLAYLALRRTHDGIDHEFTAPAAGRPLYADFLKQAATIAGDKRYAAAADLFRQSGEEWSAIAETIRTCGDATVEEGCRLHESFRELLDEAACMKGTQSIREQQTLAPKCKMTQARAAELYAGFAEHVGRIAELEREAVALLIAV